MYLKVRLIVRILFVIWAAVWTMMECGCRREKEETSSLANFSYTINWDKAFAGFPKPGKICYCFYPVDGGPMLRTDAEGDAFRIALPADTYHVLVFNCDAANMEFNKLEDFDSAEARLTTATRAASDEAAIPTPLYGIALNSVEVKAGQTLAKEVTPSPLVKEVSFEIHVEGNEYIRDCKSSLSGVASALSLSRQMVIPEEPANVTMETSLTDKGVKASTLILGVAAPASEEAPKPENQLTLDFVMKDGSTVTTTANLGHSLTDAGEGEPEVHVEVEATASPGPTFRITINSWKIAAGDSLIIK